MRTKKITLYYTLTPTKVIQPLAKELERKDAWLKDIQSTIPAEWQPMKIKVEYTIYNPEVEKQVRFFNGVCVMYYAIQNMDMLTGTPDIETLKKYREEILDEMIGYDYQTANKVLRKRKSTTEWDTVQEWNTFLKELEETLFDSAGYDFPDSKLFWELVKEHGYEEAKKISIRTLQEKMKRK